MPFLASPYTIMLDTKSLNDVFCACLGRPSILTDPNSAINSSEVLFFASGMLVIFISEYFIDIILSELLPSFVL